MKKKKARQPLKVVIAAGGTGGHLLPAQMLAKDLMEKEKATVVLIGKGIKGRSCFYYDIPYYEITSSPLKKKKPFTTGFLILKGIFQSLRLLKKIDPHVVVGFGSYHSFPIKVAAKIFRIPLVLFESNAVMGKVNRLFHKTAKKVALQLPLERPYANHVFTPFLPWNQKQNLVPDYASLNLEKDLFTFLVFGGSQGSCAINQAFINVVKNRSFSKPFQVIHLLGKEENVEDIKNLYEEKKVPCYVVDFYQNMSELYLVADLAICRAGAATIGELLSYLVPAILIPFPKASEQHQMKNAELFSKSILGGELIEEKNLTEELLFQSIEKMQKDLDSYKQNIANFHEEKKRQGPKALYEIVKQVGVGL
ncbi:MAG TPA: UDP-N-acetylglucosamine--N-acetylmuramyl-(pentapeptide) pyrophosphoryl-undecaprenol N-acetylglucosamine transferase [Chlamydiales bacterium]|nr:UDP-N-acetylglucosamine--N-acetylmuramyl-(pentapeptide) pyrophosphoryl-undecaprenol N-acetylglucosamine transferase [Chlamydiales bacterium]